MRGAHDCGTNWGRLPSGDGFGSWGGVHGLSDGDPPCLPASTGTGVLVIVHLL
ncbi:hypothetical protein PV779_52665 [Streptomyces sp. ID01-9D]|nr:hypothetical protein [Streptomyces sp. ID01-9D]